MTEPTPTPAPTAEPTPTPAPTPTPEPPKGNGPAPAPEPSKIEELPEWAQKIIRETRTEAANNRTAKTAAETQRQETLDGIAKALGLKSDDAPPDPAALQQTLSEREQRVNGLEADLRSKDVELAAWRSASKQNVSAVDLLDSRSFLTEVAQLDPTANDFATQLDAAVKKAAEANPRLRINPVPTPGAAGIGVSGSNGDASVSPGLGRLRQAYSTQ